MSSGGLSKAGLEQMHEVMAAHVERGSVPGLVWLFSRHGEVHFGESGAVGAEDDYPVAPDTIFRISSMTKPVTAVAAMILVEECRLRLDDPLDRWLPELADRRVLARPTSALDDTVAAYRPITLRDLLTFRMGLGYDFTSPGPQAVLEQMAELGLGVGPPVAGRRAGAGRVDAAHRHGAAHVPTRRALALPHECGRARCARRARRPASRSSPSWPTASSTRSA